MNNKKNTLQIVVGSLLVLLLIGVTVLLISEKRTNNELVQEFNLEKEDLENQYTVTLCSSPLYSIYFLMEYASSRFS